MSVVLVTGSSRGLGRAIACTYAKNGYDVILHYHKEKEKIEEVKEELENKYHVNTLVLQADLSKEEEIVSMCQEIYKNFPKLDVLINNAAIAIDTLFSDKTKKNFMKTLEVNLVGAFLLSRIIGEKMHEAKEGVIINISSTNGLDTTYVESLDYDASKAALISLTHNLAHAFAPYVRVNAVCPGWIKTDMNSSLEEDFVKKEEEKILLCRFAEKEEISPLVYFLGTKDASYINDSVIRIDGGVKR